MDSLIYTKRKSLILLLVLQVIAIGLLLWVLKEKKCEYYSPYMHYHFHECPETKMMDQITSILREGDEAIIHGKTYTMTPMGTLRKIKDCGCDCLTK